MSKAQLVMTDLIFVTTILIILLTISMIMWNTGVTRIQLKENIENLEADALAISDQLVRTPGLPEDWEENVAAVTIIGLANEPNVLDRNKVHEFIELDYDTAKRLLGGYDFNFTLTNSTGNIITDGDTELKSGIVVHAEQVVGIRRIVLYNNQPASLNLMIGKKYEPTELTVTAYAKNATYTRDGIPHTWFTTQIQSSDNTYAYVEDNVNYQDALEVYFDNLGVPADAKIIQVRFEVEFKTTKWTPEPGSGWRDDFEIYDNGWKYVTDWGSNTGNADNWWNSSNVASIINTGDKANNIRVKFEADPEGSGSYSYFDTVKVIVRYIK